MGVQHCLSESGSILIIVIILAASLLIIGGALLTLAWSENLIACNQEQESRLYYITEAGIEAGAAICCCDSDDISGSIGGGSYAVRVVKPPGLPEGDDWCDELPHRLAAGQRLVISEGSLEGNVMIMAVIVEVEESMQDDGYSDLELPDRSGIEGVVIVEWIKLWRP